MSKEDMIKLTAGKTVSVLGTGDFGRAMASRLVRADYNVVLGSRNPQARHLAARNSTLEGVKVVTMEEAIRSSQIVIIAIRATGYSSLSQYCHLLDKKILIEVSNPDKLEDEHKPSQAEHLAAMFPMSRLVKAFNTVSSYAIEFDHSGESKKVYICSDDAEAKVIVHQLASELSYLTVDSGGLKSSRRLERQNLLLFPGWGWPSIVMGIVFGLWLLYCMLRYYLIRDKPYTWDRLPTNVLNKAFGTTSITLLALAYMPGCFAAFIQLSNGTKNKPFSKSLDRWLKMRKQLGLYALLFAVSHMLMSMVLISPAYFSKMFYTYESIVPLNRTTDTIVPHTSRMNWNGETMVCLGFLATILMIVLGITSINSVAASLNWREFKLVQSHLGFVCLFLAASHLTVKAAPSWGTNPFSSTVHSLTFLSSILPYFTLLMKIILLLPCIYLSLNKIRSGWERGVRYENAVHAMEIGNGSHAKINKTSNGIENSGLTSTPL